QIGLMNQYHFNYLALNPALAGENGPFTIKGVVGNQFNGNLRFNQLSHVLVLDGQLYNKTGLAFQSSSDNYGATSGNNFLLSLSKGIEPGDFRLKGGISTGLAILPTNALLSSTPRVSFNAGLGVFMSYKGAFLGVSKPSLYVSRKDVFVEEPFFVNAGYASGEENFVSYNANVLWSGFEGKNNLDFNLKLWFNKRLALGGPYRINKIFAYYTREKSFIPSAEYKFTEDLSLGLAYNSNTFRYLSNPGSTNPNFRVNGIFQFYLKYNRRDRSGDSWYYDQFDIIRYLFNYIIKIFIFSLPRLKMARKSQKKSGLLR
ncbi:MAG: type IX secretion system membrane protein PorP/SprF, partial [Leadbetterella sp.]|nr:type IX secretion system membrane protein PorP/SprF [Leadbetterella sp.]